MADMVWAKLGDNFLSKESATLCSAQTEAARSCAALCGGLGWNAEAKALSAVADGLDSVLAKWGVEIPPMPFFASGDVSRLYLGDPLASFARDRLDKKNQALVSPVRAMGGEWKERANAEAMALPESWRAKMWRVDFAKRSSAVVKSPGNGLPEGSKAPELIEASMDLGALALLVAELSEPLKRLAAAARKAKLGQPERDAIAFASDMPRQFGKGRGFLAPGSRVEIIDGSGRFAPQIAYAAYLPAHPHGHAPEGFWGSTNQGGMDLASAKLFESEARAKSYFERGGFKQFALVEVSVSVSKVALSVGGFAGDGLSEALAKAESEKISKALEGAAIEQLRARLAQLEGAPAEPPAKRGSRL